MDAPALSPEMAGWYQRRFVVTVNVPLADYTVLTNSYSVTFDQGGVYTEASVISPTNVVTHLIRSEPVLSITRREQSR
jgi:uncharacterized membrane protein